MLRGASSGSCPRHDQTTGAQQEFYYADGTQDSVLTFDPSEEADAEQPTRHQDAQPLFGAVDYTPSPKPHHTPTFANARPSAPSPFHQHRRQQTAPALPALRIGVSHPRGHSRHQSDMPLTGDGRAIRRRPADNSPAASKLAGWWSGNSTPPVEEASPAITTPKSKQNPSSNTTTPAQSGLGFFASFKTRLTNNAAQSNIPPNMADDELFTMSIDAALQPPDSLAGRDTFSPAAYKNLQMNATGLLTKMQNAYRERTIALNDIQAERDAEKEETEESQLRVENLKMQLEHMAQKADEQQQLLQRLVGELESERRARHQELVAREKILAAGSMVTEDLSLDEDERKKWRKSNASADVTSIDTDLDSVESESVFSRSRSPTIMTSATESHFEMPMSSASSIYHGSGSKAPAKAKSTREMTALQKLMKNISGDSSKDGQQQGQQDGCANCHGQDASVAWDTVGLLRDENRGLKHRVAELEVAVEGALDMVSGIGMRG